MIDIIRINNKKISFITIDSLGNIKNNIEHQLSYYFYSDIEALFHKDFKPSAIFFSFPEYYFIPVGIESSNCITFALVSDWNLNFLHLSMSIRVFDFILTDKLGVSIFQRHGFNNVHYFRLFGLQVDDYKAFKDMEKKYDISFIGNLNNNIQVERAQYLYKISQLSSKYNVLITSNVYGDEYKKILAQSKITFDFTIRGELNIRVFEAMNANSLLLLEDSNLEYKNFLKENENVVLYNFDNLEKIIDYYLFNEVERNKIINNANNLVLKFNQKWFESQLFTLIFKSPFKEVLELKQEKSNCVETILNEDLLLENLNLSALKINVLTGLLSCIDKNNFLNNISVNYEDVINKIKEIDNPELINLYLVSLFLKLESETQKTQYNTLIFKYFEESIIKHINYIPLKINLITVLISENKLLEAERLVDILIDSLENNNFNLEDLRGYFINENYSRFIVEYEKSIAFNNIPYLQNTLLWKLYNIKAELTHHKDLKKEYLNKANAIIETSENLFKLSMLSNDDIEAYNYCLRALKLDPFNEKIISKADEYADLINISYEERDYINIVNSCTLLITLKNKIKNYNYKNLKNKIAIIKRQNNKGIIKNILDKMPAINTDNLETIDDLAKLYFENKYYKKALDLYVKTIQIKGKKDADTISKIKECLENLGDYDTLNKLNKNITEK